MDAAERSRQSARECRARKKLRYQYLEELVAHRERAVAVLRREMEQFRLWCRDMDEGRVPEGIQYGPTLSSCLAFCSHLAVAVPTTLRRFFFPVELPSSGDGSKHLKTFRFPLVRAAI